MKKAELDKKGKISKLQLLKLWMQIVTEKKQKKLEKKIQEIKKSNAEN